jgi:hypothetical protein
VRRPGVRTLVEQFRNVTSAIPSMSYFVLLAAVLLFLSLVSLLDPSGRRMRAMQRQPVRHAESALQKNVDVIAAEMRRRYGSRHGELLRVPAGALHGERRQEQPCLTPIDCVQDKRCDGHCGCH